ncbi:MAG: EAL domain-containing protein [Trueperaceae bacterium]|nr:EAL domain-containing protein [Trueperaceae bacterium]
MTTGRRSIQGAQNGFDDSHAGGGIVADVLGAAGRMFNGECYAVTDAIDIAKPIVHVSDEFADLVGYSPNDLKGRAVAFLQKHDTDQGADALTEAVDNGRSTGATVRAYRSDGAMFWCEQRHYPLAAYGAGVTHVISVLRDVSAAVHAAAVQDLVRDLGSSHDGDGRFFNYAQLLHDDGRRELIWGSEAWTQLSGYSSTDLRRSGLERFVHPDDRESYLEKLKVLTDQTKRQDQYRLVTHGGQVVWVEDFASRRWRSDSAGITAIYGMVRDVSHAKRDTADLWRIAHVDSLTGLPNHHLLEDRIHQALLLAKRNRTHVALAILDLDHFRFVNQTFSRRHGDRLLAEVSRRLKRTLRRTDTLARWGGDSFALLLADLPQAHAALPALEKVVAAVERPFVDDTLTINLAATLGVDLYPDGGRSAAGMIERAAEALRRGKENNRGGFTFHDATFDANMRERLAAVAEIRHAFASEQLLLHYQPRVELDSGAVNSVEALVRWAHPRRGMLKPADFLPLIEEAQLGHLLFEWTLERACRQAKRWQRQRTPRRVAVNVSAQALEQSDFAKTVQAALSRYDLHPGLLELEVSERTAVATLEDAAERLEDVRAMGVHVALDDFGIARSSLSHLRDLPLDGLKIDRSFVTRLGVKSPGEDIDLLRAIISLGKSLRLRVTAEGIETREQNSLLRTLRCDDGQGFLFSQPVPAEYVPAFA